MEAALEKVTSAGALAVTDLARRIARVVLLNFSLGM